MCGGREENMVLTTREVISPGAIGGSCKTPQANVVGPGCRWVETA